MDDELGLEDLPESIQLIIILIFFGIIIWGIKDIEPFKSTIQSIIDTVVFIGKIILATVIIGIICYIIYKIYVWRKNLKIEKEMELKGYDKYIDARGHAVWGPPEEAEKHNYFTEIVRAIEEFRSPKKYEKEVRYQDTLFAWLKSRFPDTKMEVQRGSSRPDIVIGDVAIELKGPTNHRDLDSIPSKLMRYPQHFERVIVVLFDVNVNPRYYKEWYTGLSKKHPEVVVIRNDDH